MDTAIFRQGAASLRLLAVMTVVLGLLYPLAVFAVGRVDAGSADGSMVTSEGRVVGSALIGQQFTGDEWFHSRPSAAGDGYDPRASGASNLGPENPELIDSVRERRAVVAARDRVPAPAVPPDAVTASASGLDPDISPAYAAVQVQRVATARGLDAANVRRLVQQHTMKRELGILGTERVNVLELNIAVATMGDGHGQTGS